MLHVIVNIINMYFCYEMYFKKPIVITSHPNLNSLFRLLKSYFTMYQVHDHRFTFQDVPIIIENQ